MGPEEAARLPDFFSYDEELRDWALWQHVRTSPERVHEKDWNGNTPLIAAASRSRLRWVVEGFLDKFGANVNGTN